jgi:hypothetical protein
MANETFKETVDRTKANYIGDYGDPEAIGPENIDFMKRVRVSRVHYEHAALDTKKIPIFRAEAACEIMAAFVRPETGWVAGAASEDLILTKDNGTSGVPVVVATLDGTAEDMIANEANEWKDPTNGLPGVHAPGPKATLAAGDWLYLQQGTNGAGAVMGATTLEVTYRYL